MSQENTTTSISPNHACPARVDADSGTMQVTDRINGGTVSFPKLSASELSTGQV